MDEALIKKLVQEMLCHPRFIKLQNREYDIFLAGRELNAAAFDRSRMVLENRMGLKFTEDALRLNHDQIRALIAHELAHHLFFDYKKPNSPDVVCAVILVASLCAALFVPLFAFLLFATIPIAMEATRLATSRRAEFKADHVAAEATDAKCVVALLSNLSFAFEEERYFFGLFSSHPIPQKRIEKIKKKFSKEFL
ncbi:M48 family metalloprotease [Bdellovibrio bacteriovorus]|uniref:M48 family metalloprotease n=1 Tax=Bdellovibrio bacteriovorus TaxID=959 RepID=UPI003AA82BCA